MNTFINKDALNWSKVTVKMFIMLQKISISNKCLNFSFIESGKKCNMVSTKIITVYNIDNNTIINNWAL